MMRWSLTMVFLTSSIASELESEVPGAELGTKAEVMGGGETMDTSTCSLGTGVNCATVIGVSEEGKSRSSSLVRLGRGTVEEGLFTELVRLLRRVTVDMLMGRRVERKWRVNEREVKDRNGRRGEVDHRNRNKQTWT